MNDLPGPFVYIFRATALYLQMFNANLLHNRMLPDCKMYNVLNQLYEIQCLHVRMYFSGLYFSHNFYAF